MLILDRGNKNNTFSNKFNIWTSKTSPKSEYFTDEFEPTIRIQKKTPFE